MKKAMQLKSMIENLALKNKIPAEENPANLRVFIFGESILFYSIFSPYL